MKKTIAKRKEPLVPKSNASRNPLDLVNPLKFKGFVPLVENSDDGHQLKPLIFNALILLGHLQMLAMLLLGKSGTGKSTRILKRILMEAIRDLGRAIILVDPQGESESEVLAYTREFRGENAKVYNLNFADPRRSDRWSPFLAFKTPKLDRKAARKLAQQLAQTFSAACPEGKGDSPFFRQQAVKYFGLICFALFVLDQLTFRHLHRLINGDPSMLKEVGEKAGVPELVRFAEALTNGNRNHETVVSELENLGRALDDDSLATICSPTSGGFTFEALLQPCVVLITLPEDEASLKIVLPIVALFFSQANDFLLNHARENGGFLKTPVKWIIDEFPAIGKLPLHSVIHRIRKRNISIVAATQSIGLVKRTYGDDADALLAAFSNVIALPPLDDADAQWLSERSGICTVVDAVTTDGFTPVSYHPVTRPVLLPTEISNPPRHPKFGPLITFMFANSPPFQGHLEAIYELKEHKKIMSRYPNLKFPLRSDSAQSLSPEDDELADNGPLPDMKGWPTPKIESWIQKVMTEQLSWEAARASTAGEWWKAFLRENKARPELVAKLCGELVSRKASIAEFHQSYRLSGIDNIMGNILFMEFRRFKLAEEAAKQKKNPHHLRFRSKLNFPIFSENLMTKVWEEMRRLRHEVAHQFRAAIATRQIAPKGFRCKRNLDWRS